VLVIWRSVVGDDNITISHSDLNDIVKMSRNSLRTRTRLQNFQQAIKWIPISATLQQLVIHLRLLEFLTYSLAFVPSYFLAFVLGCFLDFAPGFFSGFRAQFLSGFRARLSFTCSTLGSAFSLGFAPVPLP